MNRSAARPGAVARLDLYDATAREAAGLVIRRYSTSFGAAARLLSAPLRPAIASIYALVRVADEIVDGAAAEAGLDRARAGALLDGLERETERALAEGFSTDLIVQAFATTARRAGIDAELTRPFFASMRMDLTQTVHDDASFARYVYGSAEVVGLMCLRVFLTDVVVTPAERVRLEDSARALGAAFQKVNFLRDLAADVEELGRSYFPGLDPGAFDEVTKNRLLDDIDAELAAAAAALPLLPTSSRRAVVLAHDLFAELSRRLRRTPASEILRSRVRVPDPVKLRIAAAASLGRMPRPA